MKTKSTQPDPPPFAIKDCTLIAIATGLNAHTLDELISGTKRVPIDSIYYHFWGTLLQTSFEEREYNNDFAAWVRQELHDRALAEQLAVIDPTEFDDLEALRAELADVMETVRYDNERFAWVRATNAFEFLRQQIVVFDTGRRAESPREMAALVPTLSPSTIFYHFVDARRRNVDRLDDFRAWLSGLDAGHDELCDRLAGIDPYFGQLIEVRDEISCAFAECCAAGQ